jgi:phosphoribosyl 1,2-cyclic phosphodiesterase
MLIRFWGVRGSTPWAVAESMAHGCNTPCVEIVDERSGRTLVLDAGTGLVGLGGALAAAPQHVSILLSHYHWDHIQGLLLFAPLYQPGHRVEIFGPRLGDIGTEWAAPMFSEPFFPVTLGGLSSRPRFAIVEPGEVDIAGFHIRTHALSHPGGSWAYRISGPGGDLVYATDHELGDAAADGELATFAFNAGALIIDAHFTPEEHARSRGIGHGSWRLGAELASNASAGHLWLFHHKPGRTDRELTDIETAARQIFPATHAAREGSTFTL